MSLDLYRGINAIILGSSGFVGRWVARALNAQQANLGLVVRDRSTAEQIFSTYKIAGQIFEIDLRDQSKIEELFSRVRPAIVFNLAGYGVDPSERETDLAYQSNAQLVKTVCEAIVETRDRTWTGQSIIHVGSGLEYGKTGGNLVEHSMPRPTTLYSKSKLAGTCLLSECCRQLLINGLTVRLFSVYGHGEHKTRLLPSLVKCAVSQQPILLTSGAQRRDFTYVSDVAEGLLRLGLSSNTRPGEVVNLATGQLTSVRRFAKTAASFLGIPEERLQFGALPTRPEEMEHSNVSIERLQQLTGWEPATTVEQGILNTLGFYRN